MRPIPLKHRKQFDIDPYYKVCARLADGGCRGRITIEHALIYSGRQISEMWNYVPLCWQHHLGDGLDKRKNEYIALSRASEQDLAKYHKANFKQLRTHLNALYE